MLARSAFARFRPAVVVSLFLEPSASSLGSGNGYHFTEPPAVVRSGKLFVLPSLRGERLRGVRSSFKACRGGHSYRRDASSVERRVIVVALFFFSLHGPLVGSSVF